MHKIIFVADGAEKARETLVREQIRNVSEDFARGFADLEKIEFYNIIIEGSQSFLAKGTKLSITSSIKINLHSSTSFKKEKIADSICSRSLRMVGRL
jgi:hypothetical protein